MISKFFSQKFKEHWNLNDFKQSVTQGNLGPNFKGVEKFFRGWRAVFLVVLPVSIILNALEDLGRSTSSSDFMFYILFIFVFCLVYYKLWIEEQKYLHFYMWIDNNKDRFLNGESLMYEHSQISIETEFFYFETCFSIIFLTINFHSRPLFFEKENRLLVGLIYTVFATVFGWWGIPWGPIYTIKAIWTNVFGGKIIAISDVIDDINKNNI